MTRRVAYDAAWNIGGQMVSIGAGLVALPMLLHALGTARLGVFTLALGLIGFSGVLDMGLGRALTQTVSSGLGEGRSRADLAALVWRVIGVLLLVGVPWAVGLWLLAPNIVQRFFSLSGGLATETILGLRALAVSIPFALAATAATGALEGLRQFRLLNLWRVPMTALQFGVPTLVALFRPNVGWVVAALAAMRPFWLLLWGAQLRKLLPLRCGSRVSRMDLCRAVRFGGWLSVSNIVGPLMVYADRFYLASVFTPATVALYTVPLDTSLRATSVPVNAMNALFPALAETTASPAEAERMLAVAIESMLVLVWPPVLMGAVFAHTILQAWLGASFAVSATCILQLLLVGIFLNSMAHVPYALIQAHGHSNITAKLHLVELPVFLLLLVACVLNLGIDGAALAWLLRITLDAALLYFVAWWRHKELRKLFLTSAIKLAIAAFITVLVVFILPDGARPGLSIAILLVNMGLAIRLFRAFRAGDVNA